MVPPTRASCARYRVPETAQVAVRSPAEVQRERGLQSLRGASDSSPENLGGNAHFALAVLGVPLVSTLDAFSNTAHAVHWHTRHRRRLIVRDRMRKRW